MHEEQSPPSYDAVWQIPRARYLVGFTRRTRYCIVIPVINEGEKIRRQLERMQALRLPALADVLIADGGSTDGSLEPGFLERVGVRALLIKQDGGKLSAQLRIGYAFALEQGYEGIVTVDGNGKDGVEAIPRFLEALDRGIDYAQGSRFIAGGRAINTPRLRLAAIHLLHAPLVSLAAGRRLTDTTNGFRAYSRRYLLHPGVQPLRDIFQTYELLAYLSARASRLGLRVAEVPVTRAYPATGPVPTKINSLRGYFLLMAILLRLLAGTYAPARG